MQREEWFRAYGGSFTTNGYAKPPWKIYEQFLKVVDRPGPILELGCGNGLLLRFLCDLSGHRLQPFGADINADAIRQARTAMFPDRAGCFVHADLRDGIPFPGPFATVLANPIYADQGYYEQVAGKIPKLYLDGSVESFVGKCWNAVMPGGRLVLWCYDGHVAEIAPHQAEFRSALAATGVVFREMESGPVSFWLAERPSAG
jgi:SAM-dependent methyltransferase